MNDVYAFISVERQPVQASVTLAYATARRETRMHWLRLPFGTVVCNVEIVVNISRVQVQVGKRTVALVCFECSPADFGLGGAADNIAKECSLADFGLGGAADNIAKSTPSCRRRPFQRL